MTFERAPIAAAPAPSPLQRLRVPGWRWGVGLAAGAISFAVAASAVDLALLGTAARSATANPLPVALAMAAYTLAFWLRAIAWRLLATTRMPVRTLHSVLQASLFANHVAPFKAGEVLRPALAIHHGMPAREAVATTVTARTLDFVCLAAIAGMAISPYTTPGATGFAARAALSVIVAGAVALLAVRWWLPPAPLAIRPRLTAAHEALAAVPLARVASATPLVAISWLLEAGMVFAAANLLGADVSWRLAIGATAFTIIFQAVHVTPGGLGVYEASMTAVLVSQGVPAGDALELAVLTHALKFAYSFTAGAAFALTEGVSLLRGRRESAPKRASRLEVLAARTWNVVNEGKPFTPVFTLFVLGVIAALGLGPGASPLAWLAGVAATVPLALAWWQFDFPLRLRAALWAALLAFVALTGSFPAGAAAAVLAFYFGFTVVLWGTIYYHLRIGTRWTNGIRFIRLVCENPDPTSGNFLEQAPKVLMLVFAVLYVTGDPGAGSVSLVLGFSGAVAVAGLLLHQWFFTWVPALPQPRIVLEPPVPLPPRSRRVIAIVIDGCRADRLDDARTPVIDRLRAEGTTFTRMSTVYPARTVTCFASMLTGAAPATHGMRSNFVPSLGVKCESVFDVLRRRGMPARLVGIAHLIDAFGERDVRTVTAVMDNDDIDEALVAEAKAVLRTDDPALLVLQLLSVDQTGHARGSYNAEYLAKIEETDTRIGSFLEWCEREGHLDGATVLLTADHGQGIGIGGHGHMSPSEVRIPCIVRGPAFAPGTTSDRPVFITDFAATICATLGVEGPAASVGRDLGAPLEPESARPVVFVVPARNEEVNLPGVLTAIAASGVPHQRVVVVDDGSTDRTREVATEMGALVLSHTQGRGLGAALRSGLAVARGLEPRAVVYLDADGEYDAREAARLLAPIEAGEADYVLGTRHRAGASGMAFSRRLANRCFTGLLVVLSGRRVADGQTGFRAFSPRAADVAEIVHDYNYAQVLTLDLLRKGMRMREVPVSYRRRSAGRSFVSGQYLWRVPLGMVREMLRA